MSTKTTLCAIALTLTAGAPAARADAPLYDCGVRVVPVPGTPGAYHGVTEGFVVHPGDSAATIRCFVTVNGGEVATTPTGVGVTTGAVSYTSEDPVNDQLCAEATVHHDGSARTLETCTYVNCGIGPAPAFTTPDQAGASRRDQLTRQQSETFCG